MTYLGLPRRFFQVFKRTDKPLVDLREELKKLMFEGGNPVVISESGGKTTMVMSTFRVFEQVLNVINLGVFIM